MAPDEKRNPDEGKSSSQDFAISGPQLSLPKGGGAIRGIGEKFGANPVTGTGSMSVPIYTSPGRSGFGPKLSLSYNSGSGNSPFGFGWSLDLPSITRKTDKGLPQYLDDNESDTFILSGAEDLVPQLDLKDGKWVGGSSSRNNVLKGKNYDVRRYRPRVEGLFARIERWVNQSDPTDAFWRSISKENTTTWYGRTSESRIADPADPRRIFAWLICESHDDKGNVIAYQYKPEDSDNVDIAQANEGNRTDLTRSANRYLTHVYYGNQMPYFPDLSVEDSLALPADWHFELVLDYGDHDLKVPLPREGHWDPRADPFSSYRSTFEVRTYRLCRRFLMFHHFDDQINVGSNCLVRSTDLTHAQLGVSADPAKPFYSYLLSVTQTGHVRKPDSTYSSKSMPPLEFEYTEAEIDETVRDVDSASLENLPYGLDGNQYKWVDLDGEGASGILTEQGGSWFYKPNFSPANVKTQNGIETTLPRFGPTQLVARQPSTAALNRGRQQLVSLDNDGQLDLVEYEGATPGYYERTGEEGWEPFAPFESLPVLDWKNPNLKFIDLTGDGFPDLLISEDEAFWWHASLAKAGFGPAQRVQRALDEEKGPKLVFYDSSQTIFLADMSGDGLTDIVRIRNGEVCYWPNLGYGRFGAKVKMDDAPLFDRPDLFDGRRIRLADIDGSGTSDIIYFASGSVRLYFNQSGNGWGDARVLSHFPPVNSVSSATALDLLGNGTACLVWSSPLPGDARQPMRYIDLMGRNKPHLLTRIINNLGAETQIQYASSTKFYVRDKLADTPWLTRIPFPVHVVERVISYDNISRNLYSTRYAYHHGYYDGVEREFRGFGRVDQLDSEESAALENSATFPAATNLDTASNVPPVRTVTWFHTGAHFEEGRVSRHFESEYYREGDSASGIAGLTDAELEAMLLPDTVFPASVRMPNGSSTPFDLSPEELREASRSLRGSILRQEIYGLDGTSASDRPYLASERNYTIEMLQPQAGNRYGVFFAHAREVIEYHYERKLYQVANGTLVDSTTPPTGAKSAADPRVTHSLTLAVDMYGNVLQSVSIGYGRRFLDPALIASDQTKQMTSLYTYSENTFTNAVSLDDAYRTPLPGQSSVFELIQVAPTPPASGFVPNITSLFRFDDLLAQVTAASDGAHDLVYENLNPTGLNAGQPYRRILKRSRNYYRPDNMLGAGTDPYALLPLGAVEPLALPGCAYRLALTPGLIAKVYQRKATALLGATPSAILGSTAADGGGYVDLDSDGNWWASSGRSFYSPDPVTPEPPLARANFFLPQRYEDPFANRSVVTYDAYLLLVASATDAASNSTQAVHDYRVLQPSLLTDANNNQTAAKFDVLGLVAATAVLGKTGELGDSVQTVNADLTQLELDAFYTAVDPHTVAPGLLGTATARIVYDVNRFYNSRLANPADPTQWVPVYAATLLRETHVSATPSGGLKIQVGFSYSDGLGREIQKKLQAEPEPVVKGGAVVNPRWIASGWVIYNNKGKPVRQYEPFFSRLPAQGHQFEFGVLAGVSPILCYDPAERVVATVHPNQTYEKVVFDPWRQETWDVNDTVAQTDPTADPDVGTFFHLLPAVDYSPTWYTQMSTSSDLQENAAAQKAFAHKNSPTVAHFDVLGRSFLTIADNAVAQYPTRVAFDIEGNQLSVRDAVVQPGDTLKLGRDVMRYDYDALKTRIHQASMEAGERWMLNDVLGKVIRSWDSRGHNVRSEYDALRRPTAHYVLGTDPLNSDPRTVAAELQLDKTVYGEGQPSDQQVNLRTRVYQRYDSAGIVTNMDANSTGQNESYDVKGNLLRARRAILSDYKKLPDWVAPPQESFASSTRYDALNRPIQSIAPDGSVYQPTYNEANLLASVAVNLQGAVTATNFVANIQYNAKGQRLQIDYGNNVSTSYTYDSATFRLTRLTTARAGYPAGQQGVQDLSYVYDPVGNITHIQDDADIQNVIFFLNQRVEPSNDYTYDAIYRLVQATGREHLGQNGGGGALVPWPTSYNDAPRIALPQPGDVKAMGTYQEQYQYDPVGNIQQYIHVGTNPANPGWTRTYSYAEPSFLEAGRFSNRLSSTTLSGTQALVEPYAHDLHGNMTSMPQLRVMSWDFKDQLLTTQRQAVNTSDTDGNAHTGETTYYVYDASGQRVRKVTETQNGIRYKERIYLGGYEIYREYDGTGNNITLDRDTLHVMDDKRRIAMVETEPKTGSQLIRFQFGNHLGSSALELDAKAAVISYEEYFPFGSTSYQAVRNVTETPKRYRYTDKERDEESGLYCQGARYFAAWIGRWTACDPDFRSTQLSSYEFVRGNPIIFHDLNGREESKEPSGANRFWGGLRALGGGLQILGGAIVFAQVEVPVAAQIVGGVAIAHGLSDWEVGWRQVMSGKVERSAIQAGVSAAAQTVFERPTAEAIGTGVDIGLGFVNPAGPATGLPTLALAEASSGERILTTVVQASNVPQQISQASNAIHAATGVMAMSSAAGNGGSGNPKDPVNEPLDPVSSNDALQSVDPQGEPFVDPEPPNYSYPSRPVDDHIQFRAGGGSATNKSNIDVKTWEANSRKGGFEGQYLRDLEAYMEEGLSRADAEKVLEGEKQWLETDAMARPISTEGIESLSTENMSVSPEDLVCKVR